MKLSTLLPAFLTISTVTALAVPAVEKRDAASILSTLRSDISAHTAALSAATDVKSAQSEVKALTATLRSAKVSLRELPAAEKQASAEEARDTAEEVFSDLIPAVQGLEVQPGAGWRPVLEDFSSGVTGFAEELPAFDSGLLGLVSIVVRLVLGLLTGLLNI